MSHMFNIQQFNENLIRIYFITSETEPTTLLLTKKEFKEFKEVINRFDKHE